MCNEKNNFKKIAHVVSESVGNKILYSYDECDKCNHNFGITFEDDFAKYMLPYKIVCNIFGKKSKMAYKEAHSQHRIQMNRTNNIAENIPSKGIILDNSTDKMIEIIDKDTMKITLKRQEYKSTYVYLAFLKMALSLMPKEEYKKFLSYTVGLLREISNITIEHNICKKDKQVLCNVRNISEAYKMSETTINVAILEFKPGNNPFRGIHVELMKRKNGDVRYPTFIFKLTFINFIFYVPIICDDELNTGNKNLDFICNYIIKCNSDCDLLNFKEQQMEFTCFLHREKKDLEELKVSIKDLEEFIKKMKWI